MFPKLREYRGNGPPLVSLQTPSIMSPLAPSLSRLLLAALAPFAPSLAGAATVQTNYGDGEGNVPGGAFNPSGNLLSTHLASVSATGSYYRQSSGYAVVPSRLYDGTLGPLSSDGLGNDGNYTIMPNLATIQFNFAAAYDLTRIRTYASWDSGRSGQRYTVKYATADAPLSFVTLMAISQYNNTSFPMRDQYDFNTFSMIQVPDENISSTLVELTSSSGTLANNVVSLQFVFDGYQNGGTAYREFQVSGSAVAVPEVGSLAGLAALCLLPLGLRRR